MLCLCLIEEIIDEEEFFCFTKHTGRVIFLFLTLRMKSFSSVNKDPAEGKADFRVEKRDIPLLFDVLEYLLSSNAAMESRLGSQSP